MKMFWSEQAIKKYQAYHSDKAVRTAFDKVVDDVYENPHVGVEMKALGLGGQTHHRRVAEALKSSTYAEALRIHWAEVERPLGASPPAVLVVAVHAPAQIVDGTQHTLVALHLIYRQRNTLE